MSSRALSLLLAIAAWHPEACHGDPEGPGAAAPTCEAPAPLVTAEDATSGDGGAHPLHTAFGVTAHYVIETRERDDFEDIARRHYLEIERELRLIDGFVAAMGPATLAAVRCEPAVTRVTEDAASVALAAEE